MLLLFSAELYHHPQARDEADPISLYEIIKKIVFENYPPIFLPIADFCMASRSIHLPVGKMAEQHVIFSPAFSFWPGVFRSELTVIQYVLMQQATEVAEDN